MRWAQRSAQSKESVTSRDPIAFLLGWATVLSSAALLGSWIIGY
jgi:hypothetical protein